MFCSLGLRYSFLHTIFRWVIVCGKGLVDIFELMYRIMDFIKFILRQTVSGISILGIHLCISKFDLFFWLLLHEYHLTVIRIVLYSVHNLLLKISLEWWFAFHLFRLGCVIINSWKRLVQLVNFSLELQVVNVWTV